MAWQRAEREQLGLSVAAPHCRHLDDWLAHFGALADSYATAELWLVLLQAAQRENLTTAHQLRGLLRAQRWLSAVPADLFVGHAACTYTPRTRGFHS